MRRKSVSGFLRLALLLSLLTTHISLLTPVAHAADITTGLVGHWKLDETSGTAAADSSGNNNTGTMSGGLTGADTVSGQINTALLFNGTSDYINAGSGASLDRGTSDPLTACAWIYPTDLASSASPHILSKSAGGADDGWTMYVQAGGGGTLGFFVNSGAYAEAQTGGRLLENQWNHVCGTWNGTAGQSGLFLYVNGVLENKDSTGTGLSGSDAAQNLLIGTSDGATQFFEGRIDDVRVYGRALTAEDVAALYDNWHPGKIRYNTNFRVAEYFDGQQWLATGDQRYVPNAVSFSSAGDYLDYGSALTGVSDTQMVTGSFWMQLSTLGQNQSILQSDTLEPFKIQTTVNDRLRVLGYNSSNSPILSVTSTPFTDTDWHHVMFSFDLSDSNKRHIYIDGIDSYDATTAYVDDTLDLDSFIIWRIANQPGDGAGPVFSQPFNGNFADFWLDFGTYINFSSAENRKKFYDNGPVYLGPDGSRPTGSAPDIFLSGDTEDWHTNKGTGGGFTENGELTSAYQKPGGTGVGAPANLDSVDTNVNPYWLDEPSVITIQGDYAFVGAHYNSGSTGIAAIDISDPANITVADSLLDSDLYSPTDIKIAGNYAWTCCGGASATAPSLCSIDISNPSALDWGPDWDGTNNTCRSGGGVDIQGDYAYSVGYEQDGISIHDISNPASISYLGGLSGNATLDGSYAIDVDGDYAYVGAYDANRLVVVDVSNPASPSIAGSVFDATAFTGPVRVIKHPTAEVVYVGNEDMGSPSPIAIVDVTNKASPSITLEYDPEGSGFGCYPGIRIDGDLMYAADACSSYDLFIIDISDPLAPNVIDSVDIAGICGGGANQHFEMDITNTHLFLTCNNQDRVTSWDRGVPQCANPTRNEGTIIYNTTTSQMQFCNGEDWIAMGPTGDGGGGCNNPAGTEGQLVYNSAFNALQYCEGSDWVRIGGERSAPTTGLIGWWKFDEGSGTTAFDSSGNGSNPSFVNMENPDDWTAEGRINGGIKFDNDDEGLVLADHNGPLLVAGSVGMTMSVWVRPGEGLDLDIQEILTMESGSDDVYQLAMKWMGSSAGYGIYAKFDTTGGLTPITQTHHFTPLEGTWYHVAVTWNGGMAKTYLNGTLVDERTMGGGTIDDHTGFNDDLRIGLGQNTSFEGTLDDLRIYNRALSASEIADLYLATGGSY